MDWIQTELSALSLYLHFICVQRFSLTAEKFSKNRLMKISIDILTSIDGCILYFTISYFEMWSLFVMLWIALYLNLLVKTLLIVMNIQSSVLCETLTHYSFSFEIQHLLWIDNIHLKTKKDLKVWRINE